jgi:hypothetical protein
MQAAAAPNYVYNSIYSLPSGFLFYFYFFLWLIFFLLLSVFNYIYCGYGALKNMLHLR